MKKKPARKGRVLKNNGSETDGALRGRFRPKKGALAARRAHLDPEVDLDLIQEYLLPAVAAAAGVGDAALLKVFVQDALSSGVPLENLEEAILQCYLFAGFPAALEGFIVLREVCETPVKGRVKAAKPSVDLFLKRGEELCKRVYGPKYEPLKRRSLELHPDIWNWMILEGYGKVLSRPPLTPAQRELCIVSCLVVTGWTRQLRSHIHGALNVGCSPEAVIGAVTTAGYVAGPWPLEWGLGIAREEIAKAALGVEKSSKSAEPKRRPGYSACKKTATSLKAPSPRGRPKSSARKKTETSRSVTSPKRNPTSSARKRATTSRKVTSPKGRPASKARPKTSGPNKTTASKRKSPSEKSK